MENKKNLTILSISPIPLWSHDLRTERAGALAIALAQEGFAKAGHKAVFVVIEGANKKSKIKQKKYLHRDFLVHQVYIPKILSHISQRRYLNFISSKFYSLWYYIFAFFYSLKIAGEIKPDIIIGYTNFSSLPAYLISKIRKIPYIYRENGTWTLYDDIQTFWGRVKRFDAAWAFKLPCAAMILTDDGTQSNLVADFFGVSANKVHFWKNGIFKEDFIDLDRTLARQKLQLDATRKIIVSVGRLTKGKRFDVIIKSMVKLKQMQDYLLIIIGDGGEMFRLKELVNSLNLNKQILFTGALAHSKIWDYLIASDLLIALGSINPLLEGMSAGRCVITYDLGSTYQMTDEGKAAIVIKEKDLERLDDYIVSILNDDNKRDEMERNALNWISRGFETWDERIKKEVQLIENIAYERSIS